LKDDSGHSGHWGSSVGKSKSKVTHLSYGVPSRLGINDGWINNLLVCGATPGYDYHRDKSSAKVELVTCKRCFRTKRYKEEVEQRKGCIAAERRFLTARQTELTNQRDKLEALGKRVDALA